MRPAGMEDGAGGAALAAPESLPLAVIQRALRALCLGDNDSLWGAGSAAPSAPSRRAAGRIQLEHLIVEEHRIHRHLEARIVLAEYL